MRRRSLAPAAAPRRARRGRSSFATPRLPPPDNRSSATSIWRFRAASAWPLSAGPAPASRRSSARCSDSCSPPRAKSSSTARRSPPRCAARRPGSIRPSSSSTRRWRRTSATPAAPTAVVRLPFALSEAELYEVLQRIPDSQMPLGEGGGMLSGGEGQRVRLARAMMQSAPRLVILDEAFRGMDRVLREVLLRRCRRLWPEATFLFVTHDVDETLDCDRVIVMKAGRVVEYHTPAALAARPDSLYGRMRAANREVRDDVWGSAVWRRLEMRDGRLAEERP